MSKGGFGPLSNCSKRRFWSMRIEKDGSKSHIRTVNQSRDRKVLNYAILVNLFLFEWTKIAFSNNLKVDQNRILTLDQVDHNYRRENKVGLNYLLGATPTHDLNSFKHYCGTKKKTLRTPYFMTSTLNQFPYQKWVIWKVFYLVNVLWCKKLKFLLWRAETGSKVSPHLLPRRQIEKTMSSEWNYYPK